MCVQCVAKGDTKPTWDHRCPEALVALDRWEQEPDRCWETKGVPRTNLCYPGHKCQELDGHERTHICGSCGWTWRTSD